MKKMLIVNDLDKKRTIKKLTLLNGFSKIKVIGYKEFLKKMYFDYNEKTIVYLGEKYQINPEIAKIYLNNMMYIENQNFNNEKLNFLKKLKLELVENNYLITTPIWIDYIREYKIEFYHIFEDAWFRKIIKDCQKITKVTISNWEETSVPPVLKKCFNMEEEIIYVCSKIAKFLKKGFNPNQIYITNLNEEYREKFSFYFKLFHIPCNLKNEDKVISSFLVNDFIKNYQNELSKTFEILNELYQSPEEQELITQIKNICNHYAWTTNGLKVKKYILEDLKKLKTKTKSDRFAIHEIDFWNEEIDSNSILFVLNVTEGNFPSFFKDEKYLTDVELNLLNLSLTSEKNELLKKYTLKKLKQYKKLYLTTKQKEGKMEYYPSSVLEEIKWVEETETLNIYEHSHLFNQIVLAKTYDLEQKYGIKENGSNLLKNTYSNLPYRMYDNSCNQIEVVPQDTLKLSYSILDTYFHCSFRYYLENVLYLRMNTDSLERKMGTIFHEILKSVFDGENDFATLWNDLTKELPIPSKKDEFFLNIMKNEFQNIIKEIAKQEEQIGFSVLREERIEVPIDNNIILTGIMDKIFYQEQNDETLISVVDYKTGQPKYSLETLPYGINIQLPFYLLLMKNLPFKKIKLIGFYLQKLFSSIPEKDKKNSLEELKRKQLKLQGFSIDEESKLIEFDKTYQDSKLIQSMKTSKNGFYPYSKVLSESQIAKIIEIVENLIKTASKEIKNADFKINPKRIGKSLVGCDYCPYQSICFKREENIVNLKELKLNDILGGE